MAFVVVGVVFIIAVLGVVAKSVDSFIGVLSATMNVLSLLFVGVASASDCTDDIALENEVSVWIEETLKESCSVSSCFRGVFVNDDPPLVMDEKSGVNGLEELAVVFLV